MGRSGGKCSGKHGIVALTSKGGLAGFALCPVLAFEMRLYAVCCEAKRLIRKRNSCHCQ
jgi:hypothetical protein